MEEGICADVRIVLGGVASYPLYHGPGVFSGRRVDERAIEESAEVAVRRALSQVLGLVPRRSQGGPRGA